MRYFAIILLTSVLLSCSSKNYYYESIHNNGYSTVELTKNKELIFRLSGSSYIPKKDDANTKFVCIRCQKCDIKTEKGKITSITFGLPECDIIRLNNFGDVYYSKLPYPPNFINEDELSLFLSYSKDTFSDNKLFLSENEIDISIKFREKSDYNKYGFRTIPDNIIEIDSINYKSYPISISQYNLKKPWSNKKY